MIAIIKYLQARLKTVVVVCYVLLAVIAASSLLVDTHHAPPPTPSPPSGWSSMSPVSGLCLVLRPLP